MSAPKHTPGPWKTNGRAIEQQGRGPRELTEVVAYTEDRENPAHEANARLIAAAPEMLEALKVIRNIALADAGSKWAKTIELECADAIAKAEGK